MKKKIPPGLFVVLIVTAVVFVHLAAYFPQTKSTQNKKDVYGIALFRTMFTNVDINDGLAAIKVYLGELQSKLLVGFEIKSVLFDDNNDLLKSYSKENLAIINFNSVDYLLYKSKLPVTPMMVSSQKDSPYEEYIVLVKNDGKVKNFEDLAGKKIGMIPVGYNPIPRLWLDVLLGENRIYSKEKFFSSISESKTDAKVIMSVFFGKLDACLVSRSAFQIMSELNPQVNRQLKILAGSPGYILAVSCFTNSFMKTPYWESLYNSSLKIASYPAGRQLYTMVGTDKVIPFKEEYLNTLKKLLADYNSLKRKSKV